MRRRPQILVHALLFLVLAARAAAQTGTDPGTEDPVTPAWEVRASAAVYVLPDEENYVQPTVAADHGAWHLETRYNYEDRNSLSAFVGWNLEFGSTVVLQVTPMVGAVAGSTDGIVPAVLLDLAWKRLEFYVEGEYVLDLNEFDDRFAYHWSEASIWITEQIRTGVVTQRTRAYDTDRDIQRGLIIGAAFGRVEGAVYFFNPFDDDDLIVASIGVTF